MSDARPDRHALLELDALLSEIAMLRDEGDAARFDREAPHRFRTGDPIGFSPERTGEVSRGKYYTPEFKEQAAKKVVEGSLKVAQVARELDVNETTLGCWVAAYRKRIAGNPLPADMPDSERVRELERRVRDLEMENAFLKKAAAYFAREQR